MYEKNKTKYIKLKHKIYLKKQNKKQTIILLYFISQQFFHYYHLLPFLNILFAIKFNQYQPKSIFFSLNKKMNPEFF